MVNSIASRFEYYIILVQPFSLSALKYVSVPYKTYMSDIIFILNNVSLYVEQCSGPKYFC